MYWPLQTPAVAESEIPILNSYYLKACPTPSDPTMLWGTEVDTGRLNNYLQQKNANSSVLISGAHVLLRAVAESLLRYPKFNCRVLGQRLYRFRDINVLMPLQNRRTGEADVFLLKSADSRSVSEIAREVWQHSRNAARGEHAYDGQTRLFRRIPRWLSRWLLRLHLWTTNHLNRPINALNEQLRSAPVLVNYLSYNGAAPMRSFKPSRFPSDCWTLSVTMGPSERRPVADGDDVIIRSVASLFVRADHRIVDAYELGKFVDTLRSLLSDPWQMEQETGSPEEAAGSSLFTRQVVHGLYCPLPRQTPRNGFGKEKQRCHTTVTR